MFDRPDAEKKVAKAGILQVVIYIVIITMSPTYVRSACDNGFWLVNTSIIYGSVLLLIDFYLRYKAGILISSYKSLLQDCFKSSNARSANEPEVEHVIKTCTSKNIYSTRSNLNLSEFLLIIFPVLQLANFIRFPFSLI